MLIFPQFNHKIAILKDVHMYHVLTSYLHDSLVLCFSSGTVEIGPQHDTTPSKDGTQTSGMPCRKGSVSFINACFILHIENSQISIRKWTLIHSDLSDAVSSNTRTALSCQRNTTSAARPKPAHAG